MSADVEIGEVRGGKTRRIFKVFYDSFGKGKVFLRSGMCGKDRICSHLTIHDSEHAMKIAQAYVVDK